MREALRPASQAPDPDVVVVGKLADDIAAPTLGERATHAGIADAFDQAKVDPVVDPPRIENLLNRMECRLLRCNLTDLAF